MPEADQSQLRRVFTVLFADGVRLALWVEMPDTRVLTDLVDDVVQAVNAQEEDAEDQVDVAGADCDIFGWQFERLPVGTTVAQVPEPGVLIAVRPGSEPDSTHGLGLAVRSLVMRSETYGPRLRRFLRSPDSTRQAAPLFRYDAFVSYAAQDGPFAARLVADLRSSGFECFLAEISLAAGRLWADQLRDGLRSSRAGVIVLTPQSVHSVWVQAEVGAMWALRRPVVPALVGLRPDDVPDSLRALLPHAVVAGEPAGVDPTPARTLADQLAPILTEVRATGAAP